MANGETAKSKAAGGTAAGKTRLVIVESPAKARKIGGYLGSNYDVRASVGHIRDLAQPSQIPAKDKEKYGKFGVDVDDDFKPYYIVGSDKKQTVSDLKKALKKADELYLATDEDREGEAIAWHLVQTLKPEIPVKRMVFHEITKSAIERSLQQTRDVDGNMVDAQETRRILDRLYGYELSPVLWRKVGPKLSAGRVQSVATRLIVEREKERIAFVSSSYWDVSANLRKIGGSAEFDGASQFNDSAEPDSFKARLVSLGGRRVAGSKDFADSGELTEEAVKDDVLVLDEQAALRVVQALGSAGKTGDLRDSGDSAGLTNLSDSDAGFTVASLQKRPYRRRPVAPFTTSTLQQAAGNRLGMSSRATMRAAQALYENGYITYMRTDSVTLSGEAVNAARQCVSKRWGAQYLSEAPKQYVTKSAGAQEAHEAIRPAGAEFKSPEDLAGIVAPDQLRVYTLIWRRTLASQMADATGSTATVTLEAEAGSDGTAVFKASGTVIDFPGWLRAYGDGSGKDSGDDNGALPQMTEGEKLAAGDIDPVGHETVPPARYTEASLVKTLETREIGRPSTYASIISTIIDRGYVYERGRALIPSWLAFAVVRLLESNFPVYVDYDFTADMEKGLDEIAHGKISGRDWLERFYFGDKSDMAEAGAVKTAEKSAADKDAHFDETFEDSGIVQLAGHYGKHYEGLKKTAAELEDIDAREINTIEIGDGLAVRVGRYGPYLEDSKNLDGEGKPKRAQIPDTLAPDELTVAQARKLIETNSEGPRELGMDPETGGIVTVRTGRFGPYVSLAAPQAEDSSGSEDSHGSEDSQGSEDSHGSAGKSEPGKETAGKGAAAGKNAAAGKGAAAEKPKMASLFKTQDPLTITLEDALKLLSLPRKVGVTTVKNKDGQDVECEITAANGRYGPYLTRSGVDGAKAENRSLSSEEEIFTITVEQAEQLFAQPKYRRGRVAKPPVRELGTDPDTQKPVVIKDGFYGLYITDGETNRTLPKQYTPESIEPQQAYRLLAEKRAAGPVKRRKRATSKKTAAKKTASKTTAAKKTAAAKTTVKKAAAKKPAAKKATAKKTAA